MTEVRYVPVGNEVVRVTYEEYLDPNLGVRAYRKVPGSEEVVEVCPDEFSAALERDLFMQTVAAF